MRSTTTLNWCVYRISGCHQQYHPIHGFCVLLYLPAPYLLDCFHQLQNARPPWSFHGLLEGCWQLFFAWFFQKWCGIMQTWMLGWWTKRIYTHMKWWSNSCSDVKCQIFVTSFLWPLTSAFLWGAIGRSNSSCAKQVVRCGHGVMWLKRWASTIGYEWCSELDPDLSGKSGKS